MRRLFERRDGRWVLVLSMLATFGLIRIWLHTQPNADLNVGPYNVHHLFTGVLILTACGIPAVLRVQSERRSVPLVAGFGIGLALVLDEWVYLIVTDGSNAAYIQSVSLAGGAVCVGGACLYALLLRDR